MGPLLREPEWAISCLSRFLSELPGDTTQPAARTSGAGALRGGSGQGSGASSGQKGQRAASFPGGTTQQACSSSIRRPGPGAASTAGSPLTFAQLQSLRVLSSSWDKERSGPDGAPARRKGARLQGARMAPPP